MTPIEHRAFADAQIADYADWLRQHDGALSPPAAHAQAHTEIWRDLVAAALAGDLLWTASSTTNLTVGWLWVKRAEPGLPARTVFLYQILVVNELRRQGFGRAMLAALERELATRGFCEVRLNVWDSNTPARHLYEAAGYRLIELLAGKRQLGKHLSGGSVESLP